MSGTHGQTQPCAVWGGLGMGSQAPRQAGGRARDSPAEDPGVLAPPPRVLPACVGLGGAPTPGMSARRWRLRAPGQTLAGAAFNLCPRGRTTAFPAPRGGRAGRGLRAGAPGTAGRGATGGRTRPHRRLRLSDASGGPGRGRATCGGARRRLGFRSHTPGNPGVRGLPPGSPHPGATCRPPRRRRIDPQTAPRRRPRARG